ncbi:PREDICTED: uncharacterized protein LOC109381996 isoform X2 [Hipposideros armiger]|uniref:Uncharacterized protein LOC109381996 isoform X2 n=1 Tax=Hipposideros armiger TaxID=186990 RepID=A0A8B7R6J1_HIPAR|nr:PREDICTED: uncharacterized protein LOC109381996 isoform X2 [Hipposideros armiger]
MQGWVPPLSTWLHLPSSSSFSGLAWSQGAVCIFGRHRNSPSFGQMEALQKDLLVAESCCLLVVSRIPTLEPAFRPGASPCTCRRLLSSRLLSLLVSWKLHQSEWQLCAWRRRYSDTDEILQFSNFMRCTQNHLGSLFQMQIPRTQVASQENLLPLKAPGGQGFCSFHAFLWYNASITWKGIEIRRRLSHQQPPLDALELKQPFTQIPALKSEGKKLINMKTSHFLDKSPKSFCQHRRRDAW